MLCVFIKKPLDALGAMAHTLEALEEAATVPALPEAAVVLPGISS